MCPSDFFPFILSHRVQLLYLHDFRYISRDFLCGPSTKLLWLGDKRWGCATVCVQIGKVLTDRLLLDFQVDFYSSFHCTFSDHLFGKREVSTGHHNIECTNASALGWRSEPCPRRVCGYMIFIVAASENCGSTRVCPIVADLFRRLACVCLVVD